MSVLYNVYINSKYVYNSEIFYVLGMRKKNSELYLADKIIYIL